MVNDLLEGDDLAVFILPRFTHVQLKMTVNDLLGDDDPAVFILLQLTLVQVKLTVNTFLVLSKIQDGRQEINDRGILIGSHQEPTDVCSQVHSKEPAVRCSQVHTKNPQLYLAILIL